MSKAIVLDEQLKKGGELELPASYSNINEHNLYLYVKSYSAAMRANNAYAKNRGEVSGGGKKPWAQKGGGRARAGSITSPVFVGGGVSHGPSKRNYDLKVNKKQKRLALECALAKKAQDGKLFVVDSLAIASGKTKDAYAKFKSIGEKSVLFVAQFADENTFLAFRNIQECYLVDSNELNAYLATTFRAVVIEKAVFEEIVSKSASGALSAVKNSESSAKAKTAKSK